MSILEIMKVPYYKKGKVIDKNKSQNVEIPVNNEETYFLGTLPEVEITTSTSPGNNKKRWEQQTNEWALQNSTAIFKPKYRKQRAVLTDDTWRAIIKANNITDPADKRFKMIPTKFQEQAMQNSIRENRDDTGVKLGLTSTLGPAALAFGIEVAGAPMVQKGLQLAGQYGKQGFNWLSQQADKAFPQVQKNVLPILNKLDPFSKEFATMNTAGKLGVGALESLGLYEAGRATKDFIENPSLQKVPTTVMSASAAIPYSAPMFQKISKLKNYLNYINPKTYTVSNKAFAIPHIFLNNLRNVTAHIAPYDSYVYYPLGKNENYTQLLDLDNSNEYVIKKLYNIFSNYNFRRNTPKLRGFSLEDLFDSQKTWVNDIDKTEFNEWVKNVVSQAQQFKKSDKYGFLNNNDITIIDGKVLDSNLKKEILNRWNAIREYYGRKRINLNADNISDDDFYKLITNELEQQNTFYRGVRLNSDDLKLPKEKQIEKYKEYATTYAPDTGHGRNGFNSTQYFAHQLGLDGYIPGSIYTTNSIQNASAYAMPSKRNLQKGQTQGKLIKMKYPLTSLEEVGGNYLKYIMHNIPVKTNTTNNSTFSFDDHPLERTFGYVDYDTLKKIQKKYNIAAMKGESHGINLLQELSRYPNIKIGNKELRIRQKPTEHYIFVGPQNERSNLQVIDIMSPYNTNPIGTTRFHSGYVRDDDALGIFKNGGKINY